MNRSWTEQTSQGINEKTHFSLVFHPAIMLAIVRDALVVGILPRVPDFGVRIVAIEAQSVTNFSLSEILFILSFESTILKSVAFLRVCRFRLRREWRIRWRGHITKYSGDAGLRLGANGGEDVLDVIVVHYMRIGESCGKWQNENLTVIPWPFQLV